jgi:hypothetical protein
MKSAILGAAELFHLRLRIRCLVGTHIICVHFIDIPKVQFAYIYVVIDFPRRSFYHTAFGYYIFKFSGVNDTGNSVTAV